MENMCSTISTLIYNCSTYDFSTFTPNGFLHFDHEIICLDSMDNYEAYLAKLKEKDIEQSKIQVIDGENLLVLPGLIAGHTHIYSTFARGLSLPFSPNRFQDILDQLWWKIDKELNLNQVYYSGLSAGIEYLKSGVTTVIDHHASGEIIGSLNQLKSALCDDLGLRAGLCFETSDRFVIPECIQENIECMKAHQHSANCFGLFGLHASMSLCDETLRAVKKAVQDAPIHIHIAESQEDQEHCIRNHKLRIVERLHQFGLLNQGSILAHCIHIDEKEAQLIAENGCYVAINVTSNMNNSVDLPDFQLLKKYNIRCLIGNDGMTSDIASEWRNTLFAFHHKSKSPIGCSVLDILEMINNSYDYVNQKLDINVGKFIKGYEADVLALRYKPSTPIHEGNAFGHILYGISHQFRPTYVWSQGVLRIRNYELNEVIYPDVVEKMTHCQEIVQDLWDKLLEGTVRE